MEFRLEFPAKMECFYKHPLRPHRDDERGETSEVQDISEIGNGTLAA